MGCIIEQVTGQKYEEYIEKELLEPCAMFDSGFGDISHVCELLDLTGEGRQEVDSKIAFSAGGMYTTVLDLWRWQRALYGGDLGVDAGEWLSEDIRYNYGLHLVGNNIYMHQGELNIANAYMGYDANTDVQIIVVSNSYPMNSDTVVEYITKMMKGE